MFSSEKLYLTGLIVILGICGTCLLGLRALAEDNFVIEENLSDLQLVEKTILLPIASPPHPKVTKTLTVMTTGYSSTVDETDETPFVTASNKEVRDGIVANNYLSFGTKVRLPEIFGDKVFVVEDRMSWKKGNYHIDIWFPSREEALDFGAQLTTLEILAN